MPRMPRPHHSPLTSGQARTWSSCSSWPRWPPPPGPAASTGGRRSQTFSCQTSVFPPSETLSRWGGLTDFDELGSWAHQIAVYLEWQPPALQAEPQYRQQYWNIEGETAECSPAKETKTGEFWLPTLDVIFTSLLTRQTRDLTCCCWDKRPARS